MSASVQSGPRWSGHSDWLHTCPGRGIIGLGPISKVCPFCGADQPGPRHLCAPPDLAKWDHDEDWTCPECGQAWFVGSKDYCQACLRSDGPIWERFGTGDGKFPTISVKRGGMKWGDRR